jgi:hypothetical protein
MVELAANELAPQLAAETPVKLGQRLATRVS